MIDKCKRCGKCCRNGDFWQYSKHPIIKWLRFKKVPVKESARCLFLGFDSENKATCIIEKYLGRKWKPDVCKEYPHKGEKCFREQKNDRD